MNFCIRILSGFIFSSEERKRFREKYSKEEISISAKEYNLISLGCCCMPRYVLTKYGLKKTKEQGELSYPFDLAGTPTSSVIKLLKNNFDDYFDNLVYDRSLGYWMNTKYNLAFNHDQDCSESEKSKFVERFEKRINNLKLLLKNQNICIYFVLAWFGNEREQYINNLYKVLSAIRHKKNFRLIVLDVECKLNRKKVNKSIELFQVHHPYINADKWWKDGYRDSLASIEYCNLIVEFVRNVVKKNFNVITYGKRNLE